MKIDRALLAASWRSWISSDNRGRVGPWWLQWVWTALFCAMLAVVFTVLGFFAFARGEGAWRNVNGWLYWYGRNLIVSLTIGACIHLLFDATRALGAKPARVEAWPRALRTLYFTGVPVAGVLLGWPLGVTLAGQDVTVWIGSRDGNNIILGTVLMSVCLSFLFHQFFAAKAGQHDAERRAAEARLRLLQGQIEPHFLFNTLANVQALLDSDLPRARQMLESFTDYLRSSLVALRAEQATLGSEIELAQAYLSLLKARMDERLQFRISHDPALAGTRLPPLLLQPLVENAIHHGLEPKVEGGHLSIATRAEGGELVIEVRDDGLGLERAAATRRRGNGMALANLRERLLAMYGSAASLQLADAAPGTRATLRLPLEVSA